MSYKISPSMMCVSPFDVAKTFEAFKAHDVDYLHIDIMDGSFVPNYTLGPDYCRFLKEKCDIPLDIHLMVQSPEDKLSFFEFGAGDMVSVHAEATNHLQRAVARIKERGARACVAINPATPLCMVEEVLCDVDAVLIMTVNPGYAGQKLIPQTLDKISRLKKLLKDRSYTNVEIEVDGNVSFENARRMRAAGADIFVVGTASIFAKNTDLDTQLIKLKNALKGE